MKISTFLTNLLIQSPPINYKCLSTFANNERVNSYDKFSKPPSACIAIYIYIHRHIHAHTHIHEKSLSIEKKKGKKFRNVVKSRNDLFNRTVGPRFFNDIRIVVD